MKHLKLIFVFILICFGQVLVAQPLKHRLIILADMGNEPDEEQQMAHMLMGSNEFDLEGLMAVAENIFTINIDLLNAKNCILSFLKSLLKATKKFLKI